MSSDCTGSSHKKNSAGADFNFDFVVLNHGKEIEGVQTYPGSVVTFRAERSD